MPSLDQAGKQLYQRVVADNRKTYGALVTGSPGRVENGVYAYRAALTPFCAGIVGDASTYTNTHLPTAPS